MMRHGDDDNDDVDAQLSISSKPHLALEGSPQKDLHDDNNNDSDEQLSISFEHRMALEPRPSEDQGVLATYYSPPPSHVFALVFGRVDRRKNAATTFCQQLSSLDR